METSISDAATPRAETKRSKRRKRRSAASQSASGTATPQVASEAQQLQQPSTSGANGSAVKGFEGEDYIEFTFSDPSDDDEETSFHVDAKGKGKARDFDGDSPASKFGGEERSEGRKSRRDGEDGHGDRAGASSSRGREREWDRGKRGRDPQNDRVGPTKQYEMIFDFDSPASLKQQRFDPYSSKKSPWVEHVDWDRCKNVAEMLHREVEAFVEWISPSPVEDEIRGLIVTQISNAIRANFPDAKILPFGSYETKLYLPLGDIDLVVLSDSMAWSDKVSVLHALANALKRSGVTSRVSIIAKAKVPIVKFVSSFGRFNVDISVNQSNGLLSGKIINGFLNNIHPRGPTDNPSSVALRSLIMITKAFLAQRSMNEVYTGGLGSYSIVCLAVSFLQMHPKIRSGEIDPEENLGVLVMEFFELYGCFFNYDEVGVSLRDGGTYFSKRQRGWTDYKTRGLLSIEDPADPSNDISKGSFGFHKVKTAFAGAHSILTSTAYIRAGMLHSRRNAKSVHLRDHYEPEDLSILSTVMGITQETINHRRLIQELYESRKLHDAVGVKPRPRVVKSAGKTKSSPLSNELKIKGSSVRSAWKEADGSDSDVEQVSKKKRRDLTHDEGDDDDDGRYGIGQPPRKRQRTGARSDFHTVFVTDDDEEGEYGHTSNEDEDPPSVKSRKARSPGSADRKRDFWLSKGIGFGDAEGSD